MHLLMLPHGTIPVFRGRLLQKTLHALAVNGVQTLQPGRQLLIRPLQQGRSALPVTLQIGHGVILPDRPFGLRAGIVNS